MTTIRPILGALALVLALIASGGGTAAQSAPETKVGKARELFRVAQSQNVRLGLYHQGQFLLAMRFAQANHSVRSEDMLQVLKEELEKAVDQNLPTLADQVVAIFVEDFTEDELDAIWIAEESRARQSMMAKMPAVGEKTAVLIRAWGDPLLDAVLQRVEERLREEGLMHKREEEVPLE